MRKILLILSIIPLVFSMIEINGKCPEAKSAERFDASAFMSGLWYQVARYKNDWEKQGDCPIMEFKTENNVVKFNLTEIFNGIPKYFTGYIDNPVEAKTSGVLDFNSPSFKEVEGDVLYARILATDNRNYALGYECRYNEKKNKSIVEAWLSSRTKQLENAAKAAVDNFLKTSRIVDANKLSWNHFTDDACKL